MENQAPSFKEIPLPIIQQLLQEHLNDSTVVIKEFKTELMTHEGFGGNPLWRVSIAWQVGSEVTSANWIIKRWNMGGRIGRLMGVTQPTEALAWLHGVIQPQSLPEGIEVPYIGIHLCEGENSAWIVMDDISNELNLFRSSEALRTKIEKMKFILDRLAQFHLCWEQPERLSLLKEHSWLLPQERYLWASADNYAIWLGRKATQLVIQPDEEPLIKLLRKGVLDFLAWLPKEDRDLWETNMCDRQPLIKAFTGLPQTLTHGDLAWHNIGLCWENHKKAMLLLDWELIGIGSPAMDVARLIALTLDFEGDLSAGTASLSNYYFERYMAQGGTLLNTETWEQSYDLATLFINLWQFPFFAGFTVGKDPTLPKFLLRDIEMIRQKTEHTTELMRRWLG